MDPGAIHLHRSFDSRAQWQIGNLACVWKVRCKVIMIACTGYIFDHLKRALTIRLEQAFDGHRSIRYFIQTVESEVAYRCKQIPLIQTDAVFVPGLCSRIAHPWKIFTQMGVPGDWEQAKG